MELIIIVVAITNKAMSSRSISTIINNRAGRIKFRKNNTRPSCIRIIISCVPNNIVLIAKIIEQSILSTWQTCNTIVNRKSTTPVHTITHLHSNANMIHQRSNSLHFSSAASTTESRRHVSPIISGCCKISREYTIIIC